ncbi:hypothetical protein LVJ59_17575 [Microbacterium sp. KKR3/1]|uniref:DUF7341 domain-containing protein n=1 Tax=Microbacterium sp. KKR3/1 TaxID=2904241 RepID=UPI001E3AE559|nr:hypothetical protein [Microbacterium sp. KKR3/1]MCE0510861.1 hypothetical protein [Microbacterium sp. KKR3/1]
MSVDVETLTRDHKVAVTTDEGIVFHTVPSLISQLRDAVFGGMESTGGSSMKARLPISEAALDQYMVIDRQISEVWVQAFERVPGKGQPEALLSEWAAWAEAETIVTAAGRDWYAKDLVAKWVGQIEDFFNPPRLAEIDANCPNCDERYVYSISAGEEVRDSALRFNRSRATGETLDARCLACGEIWLPVQFERLAVVFGIDVEAKKKAHYDAMSEVDGIVGE